MLRKTAILTDHKEDNKMSIKRYNILKDAWENHGGVIDDGLLLKTFVVREDGKSGRFFTYEEEFEGRPSSHMITRVDRVTGKTCHRGFGKGCIWTDWE